MYAVEYIQTDDSAEFRSSACVLPSNFLLFGSRSVNGYACSLLVALFPPLHLTREATVFRSSRDPGVNTGA